MRFSVEDIVNTVVSDAGGAALHRALCALVDDLNSELLYYEVTLEHYDTGDYLRFEKRSPEEIADILSTWKTMEANLGG